MKVYAAFYNGTDGYEILGVYEDIKKAQESIYKSFVEVKDNYKPTFEEIEDNRIYREEKNVWFDEWLVVETEMYEG
jgi:hypothetical protein